MKIILSTQKRVNANCYVNKLGYSYPILIYNRYQYNEAVDILSKHPSFGTPAQRYHFTTWGGLGVKSLYVKQAIENRKWYSGTRQWNDNRMRPSDFWLVFKTEKDRTLATMLLT